MELMVGFRFKLVLKMHAVRSFFESQKEAPVQLLVMVTGNFSIGHKFLWKFDFLSSAYFLFER